MLPSLHFWLELMPERVPTWGRWAHFNSQQEPTISRSHPVDLIGVKSTLHSDDEKSNQNCGAEIVIIIIFFIKPPLTMATLERGNFWPDDYSLAAGDVIGCARARARHPAERCQRQWYNRYLSSLVRCMLNIIHCNLFLAGWMIIVMEMLIKCWL